MLTGCAVQFTTQGWDKKPGVKIVFGRWQDVIHDLGFFDGIFFDTYGEFYDHLKEFHEYLGDHLKYDFQVDGLLTFTDLEAHIPTSMGWPQQTNFFIMFIVRLQS